MLFKLIVVAAMGPLLVSACGMHPNEDLAAKAAISPILETLVEDFEPLSDSESENHNQTVDLPDNGSGGLLGYIAQRVEKWNLHVAGWPESNPRHRLEPSLDEAEELDQLSEQETEESDSSFSWRTVDAASSSEEELKDQNTTTTIETIKLTIQEFTDRMDIDQGVMDLISFWLQGEMEAALSEKQPQLDKLTFYGYLQTFMPKDMDQTSISNMPLKAMVSRVKTTVSSWYTLSDLRTTSGDVSKKLRVMADALSCIADYMSMVAGKKIFIATVGLTAEERQLMDENINRMQRITKRALNTLSQQNAELRETQAPEPEAEAETEHKAPEVDPKMDPRSHVGGIRIPNIKD